MPLSPLQALAARLDADSGADIQAELVLKTLQFLLRQWAQELNSQPDAVKRAYQGKIAIATHRQTETYLKPLFKQLKRKVWQPFALSSRNYPSYLPPPLSRQLRVCHRK